MAAWAVGGEVASAVRNRVTRDVTAFAGLIDHWDAINEAVIMPRFTAEDNALTPLAASLGRVETVRLAMDTARAANPGARLVLNDFLLTEEYARLIEECLAAGVEFDAIGLQTHMHQGFRGEDEMGAILERFGRFGLPLQLTEVTLVSGDLMPPEIVDLNDYQVESWPSTREGEARQADDIERLYRLAASDRLVESVTYWGLCDRDTWLGAPAGLLRADGSRKPSYEVLQALIHDEWWVAPHSQNTTADGHVEVSGWGGRYRIDGRGGSAEVTVTAWGGWHRDGHACLVGSNRKRELPTVGERLVDDTLHRLDGPRPVATAVVAQQQLATRKRLPEPRFEHVRVLLRPVSDVIDHVERLHAEFHCDVACDAPRPVRRAPKWHFGARHHGSE